VLFGLLWLGQLATVALSGPLPDELVRLRLPTSPIDALDLAFFVPACVATAVGLLRGGRTRVPAPSLLLAIGGSNLPTVTPKPDERQCRAARTPPRVDAKQRQSSREAVS
jgi:hypothetical protein